MGIPMPLKRLLLLTAAVAALAVVSLYPQGRTPSKEAAMPHGAAFRISLGIGDRAATSWDGSISVSPGRIAEMRGWHFSGNDSIDGVSHWTASTRASTERKGRQGAILETGVVVAASDDDPHASFDVKTAQGSFSFRAQDIAWAQPRHPLMAA